MGDIQSAVNGTGDSELMSAKTSRHVRHSLDDGGSPRRKVRLLFSPLFIVALLVALIAALVYVSTTPATIHADDSGETVVGCFRLDVPHPPGYPLYSLLGRIFCFIPMGSLAWRVNLLSVLLGAATVFLLVILIRLLARRIFPAAGSWTSVLIAGVAALLLAFSRNFWLQSTGAKGGVYTLNTVVLAVCFILLFQAAAYVAGRDRPEVMLRLISERREEKYLYPLFFLLGLGMTNHLPSVFVFSLAFMIGILHLLQPMISRRRATGVSFLLLISAAAIYLIFPGMVLFIPPVLLLLLSLVRPRVCRFKLSIFLIICFLLGLSIYLYLPLRAAQGPPINWYSPTKLARFLDVIMRRPYLEGEKLVDKDWVQLLRQLGQYLLTFKNEFNYLSSFFGLLGLAWLLRRGRRVLWTPLLAGYLMLVAAAVVYPSFQEKLVWVLDNYFLPANMIFAVFIGLGLLGVAGSVWRSALGRKALVVLLLLLPLIPLWRNYQRNDGSYCYYSYDYGKNILATVERDGIIFGEGDYNLMPLYYLLYAEKQRPDISLVTSIFLHFDWGLKNLQRTYPQLTLNDQGGDINQRIIDIVRYNAPRNYPIYYSTRNGALEEFDIPIKDYLAPNGLLLRFVSETAASVSLEQIETLARPWGNYCLRNLEQRLPCVDGSTDLLFSYYASGYVNLGNSLQRLGQLDDSSDNYNQALKILRACWQCDDDLAPIYSNLSAVAGRKHDYVQAKALVERALQLDPEYAGAYANLGNIFRLQGDFIKAEETYRRALSVDPDSAVARSNLEQLMTEDKSNLAWQHVMRGDEHSRVGEDNLAVEEYELAIELGLQHPSLFSNLGVMYAKADKRDQAEEYFRKALELEADFVEAYRNLAVLYYKAGDSQKAWRTVKKGLARMPDDPGLRQLRDVMNRAQ